MKKIIIGWVILLVLIALALIFFIWQDSFSFLPTSGDKWLGTAVVLIVALVLSHLHNLVFLLLNKIVKFNFKLTDQSHIDTDDKKPAKKKKSGPFSDITVYLSQRYGLFWRRRVRKLLVVGSESDTERLLPNLTRERWQIADNTLMIYGGDHEDELNMGWLKALKTAFGRIVLLRRKPIDGLVWLLPDNYLTLSRTQQARLENSILQIQARNKALNWQAPVYFVSTQDSEWSQTGRTEQGVGTFFNGLKINQLDAIDKALDKLAMTCCEKGTLQVMQDSRYAFLLQLSQNLIERDKSRIKQWLAKWLALPHSASPRALLFSPLLSNEISSDESLYVPEHHLAMTPTWQTISVDAAKQRGKRMGLPFEAICCSLILAAMAVMSIGIVTSYYQNRSLIINATHLVSQIDATNSDSYAARLQSQYALQLQMDQLIYRQHDGVPIRYRFGLSHNDALLTALWPHYITANDRNIATPFLAWQTSYLTRVTNMSPADPNRAKLVNASYNVLKAYLMLTRPDKADAAYLSEFATQTWPAPNSIAVSEWQKLMPELVAFWGRNLSEHPQWAQKSSLDLVKDVRQILINQIGLQNAENTIYQAILQRAGQNYAKVTLVQLLGDIDSRMLFSSTESVPGVFTRKAWEDVIKSEIASAAKSRKEQIDWVLSDGTSSMTSSVSPDALKQHLTERYFSDYSAAWLLFLNNIQWRQADNIADVIEQLTLMSDVRQSPLVALMNVVKYQAEVAYSGGGISDNLIRSAQELIKDKNPAKLNAKVEASGPLTPTFGPLLNLLNVENNNSSSDLTLQTYLLRVTQVRLKLQNITSSANPQATAKLLAKSVFQGTSVDLTETRDYGNLIAANLGEEWSGFGYTVFKQPLEQAWQVILTPAAKSFNDIWQTQIVYEWEKSFAGRYPFKDSDNDASLAELARFLRPDAGIVDKFIASELGGILEKQGDKWVINPVNAQGLHFSPQFIDTLNLFNNLSSQLLTSGDAKIAFDIMARSGYNVARSELIIDKQKLDYFNQMPAWQRFSWPGDGYSPYAQLSYSRDDSGLQLYDYYAGDWAWIRLLESAFIRQLDSSRYELVWKVGPEHNLKYILRSQSGEGPLTLLQLRHFVLPKQVFDVSKSDVELQIDRTL
ncbi:type VI secretion system protein ImpL [Orbus hercynius]|uniref:Type VI secretion system protein ImpL n=1 Tax=Orbus hercynius TaxID=593135 RepID=A0A495RBB5_9GAMM|nr:ImcF-related family protein [Orbus hercynius]RKS84474.1 type VI secretion system protein ImpL [Orbus hercynius]